MRNSFQMLSVQMPKTIVGNWTFTAKCLVQYWVAVGLQLVGKGCEYWQMSEVTEQTGELVTFRFNKRP